MTMEIWMGTILAFTAVYALILTPWTVILARRIGAVDIPDERKIHDHAVPRLGGVAVFTSILFAAGTLALLQQFGFATPASYASVGERILFPSLLMLFLGIVDDVRSLEPGVKFIVQLG